MGALVAALAGSALRLGTAIVPAFDMAHSWAFQETKLSDWQTSVQARPMTCRFDPSLTIPRESLPRIEGSSAESH